MAVEIPSSPPPRGRATPPIELPAPATLARSLSWCKSHALFIVGVTVVVALCFVGIPGHLSQDGWLALLAGRIVAQHGIPSHDYLTVMTHGVRWTDQQWLAQLLMYGLQQLGGLQLLTVVYVLVTGAAFAAALAAARRLGAQDLHILMLLAAGAFLYLATAVTIRTQGFVYPLFVATVWLLASEFPRAASGGAVSTKWRAPARWRAYLVFPILVLWANLHGSVTLAVGVVVIFGVCLLLGRLSRDGWRGLTDLRGWSFIVIAPLTLLATPYGTSIIHYYSVTLMNPQFSHLVSEWQPVIAFPILAVPLFLLMAAAVVIQLRNIRRTPLFDQLVLVVLGIGAVIAVRNITWFGLASVVLLPPAISRLRGDRPARLRRARINLIFALVMIGLTVLAGIFALTRPNAWFQSSQPPGTLATVQRLARQDPSAKIFADVRYADWLVWKDPALAGRIAYDTSFELLTAPQLRRLTSIGDGPNAASKALLDRYGIWVLYAGNHHANRLLLAQRGVQIVFKDKHLVIATNPVSAG